MENTQNNTDAAGKKAPVAELKCKIEGCKRPYRAKSYCNVHYRKWRQGEMPHARWKNIGKTSATAKEEEKKAETPAAVAPAKEAAPEKKAKVEAKAEVKPKAEKKEAPEKEAKKEEKK